VEPLTYSELVGRSILIGVTWVDEVGQVTGRSEFAGRVIAAAPDGIVVQRSDGHRDFTLPGDTSFIQRAAPGVYRLKSSGEEITDPDFLCAMRMVAQTRESGAATPPLSDRSLS
jgi:hypothetical protein